MFFLIPLRKMTVWRSSYDIIPTLLFFFFLHAFSSKNFCVAFLQQLGVLVLALVFLLRGCSFFKRFPLPHASDSSLPFSCKPRSPLRIRAPPQTMITDFPLEYSSFLYLPRLGHFPAVLRPFNLLTFSSFTRPHSRVLPLAFNFRLCGERFKSSAVDWPLLRLFFSSWLRLIRCLPSFPLLFLSVGFARHSAFSSTSCISRL